MSSEIDWAPLALGELHQARTRTLCERMLGVDSDEIEGAILYVIEELARDDWAKCRKFQGKSKPETWLYSLTVNIIREYRQKHISGKKRPPVWIQEESAPIWERVWRLLMVSKQRPTEIIHELTTGNAYSESEVRDVIRTIQQRDYQSSLRRRDNASAAPTTDRIQLLYASNHEASEHSLENLADDHEDDWRQRGYEELLLWLDGCLGGTGRAETVTTALDPAALTQARNALADGDTALGDEALLILRLHFVENQSWQQIARTLNLPGHQPARIARRACRDIGTALASAGIALSDLLPADELSEDEYAD
ncbi:hypothetical protein K8B33_03875 [Alcanivorax sp. JB21]|uniref:hypothetical protein n=1 Tax=Alcanivorax limicola TaxID=2874102 RepID=UPI001CBBCD6D|nr:hypothetical protein [Alcanivorax limicola]MBZ2188219.1 hypothetical protein [Alcanivorax limicola]